MRAIDIINMQKKKKKKNNNFEGIDRTFRQRKFQ